MKSQVRMKYNDSRASMLKIQTYTCMYLLIKIHSQPSLVRLFICEFFYLLKFITDPGINTHVYLTDILKNWSHPTHSQLLNNIIYTLLPYLCSCTVNKYLFHNLQGYLFCIFMLFVSNFSEMILRYNPGTLSSVPACSKTAMYLMGKNVLDSLVQV